MKIRHEDTTTIEHLESTQRRRGVELHALSLCELHWLRPAILCLWALAGYVIVILALNLTLAYASGEIIDRLLVAVNGKVITEGDLKSARALNDVLMLGKVNAKLSDQDEIQRLIDLELLRQELESFSDVTGVEEEVEGQMEELRKSYAKEGGLTAILGKLGLEESALRAYLSLQDSILKLIDFRFRPFVSVTDDEIQQYYHTTFVPRVQASGASVPALEGVTSKIKEILAEEKVDTSLNQWLQDSRRRAQIEYFSEGESLTGGTEK
jgi:peptidyl-prolyl cis-trans isomerase SurA